MLAHILALTVGLGSIAIYLVAFFFPEIHRKNDFIWSGVGFFYALVLWIFAHRITGGLLLGHIASVALLGWLGWQTFSLRRQLTPQVLKTPIPSAPEVKAAKVSLLEKGYRLQKSIGNTFSGFKNKAQKTVTKMSELSIPEAPEPITTEPSAGEIIDQLTSIAESPTPVETPSETATSKDSTTDDTIHETSVETSTPVETAVENPTPEDSTINEPEATIPLSEQTTRIITDTDTKLQKNE